MSVYVEVDRFQRSLPVMVDSNGVRYYERVLSVVCLAVRLVDGWSVDWKTRYYGKDARMWF